MKKLPPPPPIEMTEINEAIGKLKRGKSTGIDLIPNEAFIEANKETREIYRKALNRINNTLVIPGDIWQEAEIIKIYKGKGKKENCHAREEYH